MKILHTSDWHVGRTLHGADLTAAHELFFHHLIDMVHEHRVSAVLISGDLFDRSIPATATLLQVESVISHLASLCQVIISPGNHDSATRLGFLADQLGPQVTIVARADHVGQAVMVTDPDGGRSCLVYPLPYLDPDSWRVSLSDEAGTKDSDGVVRLPRSHRAVIGAALRRVAADLEVRKVSAADSAVIVMAHAFVTGASGSDSERDISVGGVDSVPAEVFTSLGYSEVNKELSSPDIRCDYAALGHLHRPQIVAGDSRLRYCGSPVPFSFSEAGYEKSVTLLDIDSDAITAESLPVPIFRPLKRLRGTIDEVLSHRDDADSQDAFVEVVVTDSVRPVALFDRIREVFPHALVIRHEPEHPVRPTHAPQYRVASDPTSVLVSFLADMAQRDPLPEEVAILRDAYEAVRSGEGS